jgi:hypothetical protein
VGPWAPFPGLTPARARLFDGAADHGRGQSPRNVTRAGRVLPEDGNVEAREHTINLKLDADCVRSLKNGAVLSGWWRWAARLLPPHDSRLTNARYSTALHSMTVELSCGCKSLGCCLDLQGFDLPAPVLPTCRLHLLSPKLGLAGCHRATSLTLAHLRIARGVPAARSWRCRA